MYAIALIVSRCNSMQVTLMNTILGLLFPRRETAQRVDALTHEMMHAKYIPTAHETGIALASYHDPDIRACIHELKYHDSERATELLRTLITVWYEQTVTEPVTIIPVPLSRKRHRERGYNQVTRIVSHLTNATSPPTIVSHTIERTRHTTPQTKLDRQQRTENVHGTFSVRPGAESEIIDRHIVIVDDVTTTGATLRAMHGVVSAHHPRSITCLTLAH